MARHQAPIRKASAFRRRPGTRPPRAITLIVCEGETECTYFATLRQHLKLTAAEVVIPAPTHGSAPISVVDYAIHRGQEPGGFDRIYCVFDRDRHSSFTAARQKLRDHASRARRRLPLKEAVSIPCFEVWVLMHFEQTDRPFVDAGELEAYIRQHHRATYAKASAPEARHLMGLLETALRHSQWLAARTGPPEQSPSTSVHELVTDLQALARS